MHGHRSLRSWSVIVVVGLTALVLTAVPASAAPRCFGEAATIVGTGGDDTLRGTSGPDVIVGRGGNDLLRGRGGGDVLCGGPGHDILFGRGGGDRLDGGGGFDGLQPGDGDDLMRGGGSSFDGIEYPDATGPISGSLVTGEVTGMGTDTIESGVEQIVGGPFDDVIEGDDGFNVLIGLAGNDTISALGGDFDALVGGGGDDALDGGEGFDFVENYFVDAYMSSDINEGPMVVNLATGTSTGNGNDTLAGIEHVNGSMGDDVIVGSAGDDQITQLFEGDDTVDGGDGDDTIDGGEGADDLDGGLGVDTIGFLDGPGGVTIDLGTATDSDGDTIANFENVIGSFFADSITGNDAANEIFGLGGADEIFGLGGDDVIFGDGGTDSADGGPGADQCSAETETACETDPPPPPRSGRWMRAMLAKGVRG